MVVNRLVLILNGILYLLAQESIKVIIVGSICSFQLLLWVTCAFLFLCRWLSYICVLDISDGACLCSEAVVKHILVVLLNALYVDIDALPLVLQLLVDHITVHTIWIHVADLPPGGFWLLLLNRVGLSAKGILIIVWIHALSSFMVPFISKWVEMADDGAFL